MKLMVVGLALLLLSFFSVRNGTPQPDAVASPDEVYLDCTCPTHNKPPDPRKLYKKDANYEFSWISDADSEEGGGWCYFNGFKNLHKDNVAVFDFKPARMKVVIVPPGGEDVNRIENQPPYEYPVKAFDLYYSPVLWTKADLIRPQVQNSIVDTSDTVAGGLATVTAQSRINTSKPILAEIKYDLRDPETKVDYKVVVALTSSVKGENKKYRYSFSMVNQGRDTLRFEWEALSKTYDPAFMEILKKTFLQGKRTDEPGIELRSGEKFEIEPLSGKSPGIIPGIINIYRNNTFLAQGFAPAFIPGRD